LGWFQASKADKEGTRRLLQTINTAVSEDPIPIENLDRVFNALWPDLEATISKIPPPDEAAPVKRQMEDMVAEILEITRSDAKRRESENVSANLRSLEDAIISGVGADLVTSMYSPTSQRRATLSRSLLGGMPSPQPGPQGYQGPTPAPVPVGYNGPAAPAPATTADLGGMPAPVPGPQGPTPAPRPTANAGKKAI